MSPSSGRGDPLADKAPDDVRDDRDDVHSIPLQALPSLSLVAPGSAASQKGSTSSPASQFSALQPVHTNSDSSTLIQIQSGYAHFHGSPSETQVVDESSSDCPSEPISTLDDDVYDLLDDEFERPPPHQQLHEHELMTKDLPPLRNAPGFRSPSYGSITPRPSHETDAHDIEGSTAAAAGAARPREDPSISRRSTRDFGSWRSRQSTTISPNLTMRTRSSRQSLGGAAAVGGLEGRFGTETSLLNDLTENHTATADEDDGARSYIYDSDGGVDDNDHDPPDNSPYSQVRASVSPTDNTSLSINTPRMWTMSILFSILGSSTNLFFSLRYPSVAITPVIALLLVHPLGLMWDYILKRADDPPEEYIDGFRSENASISSDHPPPTFVSWNQRGKLEKLRLWLGQGRWNEKEHSCVYVSSNVSFGFAFATDVIVEQTQFYKQEASITYQLLLTLSTQILGYTFAGLTRRFLVRPSGMIWPGTLMSAAMFTTLHKEENAPANGWRISRWKFFYVVWFFSFIFYFLPGLLMPALSYFNVVTWFAPDNVVVANLFGVVSGLGLFPLTFDWAQIAYIGSPLLTPFWAAMNVVGGLVIVMWIIAPIAYYSNWLYSSYMPILSAAVFDNTGSVYDVGKVLTKDFLFDKEAYSQYSRVFLPITYVLSYGVQFAGLAALITHTVCWHGKDIWTQWNRSVEEMSGETKGEYQAVPEPAESSTMERSNRGPTPNLEPARSSLSIDNLMSREDVHNRLMRRYKDAPMTWYLMTFVSMLAIGIFVVEYYPIHLPWYGLLLALGICSVLFIPIGIIMAVTNQHSSIYLICQLVAGLVFPGRPVANMVFVTYGYISSAQGIKFAADLKLGHYMKIPPRILFAVQMVATIVSSVTQIGVLNWMFVNVPGICTPQAINGFTCPIARVHFNGSILWGVVGPKEFFGPGATYRVLVWAFAIGAILPIPLWLYARKRKDSIVRKINLPVLFGSLGWIPPATGLNFSVWALVCFLFNYLIKNRASAWWAKYTMTLSAALDSGLAFGIVVVFFGFIYPGVTKGFTWWGTEVYKQGCDWQACSYLSVPEGGKFGPETW
ncbi:OPT oligopeptide transporter protein-domain-containing protein [Podospora australis]|uniref:OPT oligopeptide transporter protein-domain-containing protein n=1 Tax=Podospora australis TaxID=1536484 RepID=A0AAN6X317_9PEZI|nr:OPT oligopeptide transporter protein-domain-containing protein [Podospora australis]